jgi:hypothetical protein
MKTTEKDLFVEVVRGSQKDTERTLEIYEKMFLRNYDEILKSRKIHYLCCTERHLLISQNLVQAGIEPTGIILDMGRPFQRKKFGCALEIKLDGQDYSFFSANSGGDKLIRGNYQIKGPITGIQRKNIYLDHTLSWFDFFDTDKLPISELHSLIGRIQRRSSDKSLKKHLESISQSKLRGESI